MTTKEEFEAQRDNLVAIIARPQELAKEFRQLKPGTLQEPAAQEVIARIRDVLYETDKCREELVRLGKLLDSQNS